MPTGGSNSDWNKVLRDLDCAVADFLAGFFPGVSPLGGACPRFAGLLIPNRRQSKWKYLSRFKTSKNP